MQIAMRVAGMYKIRRRFAGLTRREQEALDHAKQLVREAVWTFEPSKQVKFSTFAWTYSVYKVSERMHVAFSVVAVPGVERTHRHKCVHLACVCVSVA
jgi:hypothetical protein